MVWEASPALVLASALIRLLRALLPLAMLWVSKLILDAVVGWISYRRGTQVDMWKLVFLELTLVLSQWRPPRVPTASATSS